MLFIMMIDTHAHPLLCSSADASWFERARTAGVSQMIGVATTIQMGLETLELSKQFPAVHPTIGIHPCEAHQPHRLEELPRLISHHPEFKAIGEIGLDFYRNEASEAQQVQVFKQQLEIARGSNLPVILHSRQADHLILEVLAEFPDVPKVFHCFSSDIEFAKKACDEMTFFSFTGMVTYTNKRAGLDPVLAWLPIDKLMIETDCPYLTPTRFQGQENHPEYVGEVAQKIAEIKHLSLQAVQEITTQNAQRFFRI